jgi:hypothetical protein
VDRPALALKTDFWSTVLPEIPNREWLVRARKLTTEAEIRRKAADYQTGSILESEAYALMAVAEHFKARVVIEVGTFVGLSTTALASVSTVEAVYTCDASNDCLPSDSVIRTFPKKTSTDMLRHLVQRVQADFCFFDGALSVEDVQILRKITFPDAIYAVHDYGYGQKVRRTGVIETVPRKGTGNINLLLCTLDDYEVIAPEEEASLALLIPESRL